MKISPSILSADFSALKEEVTGLQYADADWIHIDVMDGHFVPNITMGPDILKAVRAHTTLPLDVHLMISNPDQYIQKFARSGADFISVHQEACLHLDRTLATIKENGVGVGVAINPATPVHFLEPVLHKLDLVVIMSVNPGFGGQSFIQSTLDKITQLRKIIDEGGYDIEIEVDGGINAETAAECVHHGATVLVAGSYIFHSANRKEAIQKLRWTQRERLE